MRASAQEYKRNSGQCLSAFNALQKTTISLEKLRKTRKIRKTRDKRFPYRLKEINLNKIRDKRLPCRLKENWVKGVFQAVRKPLVPYKPLSPINHFFLINHFSYKPFLQQIKRFSGIEAKKQPHWRKAKERLGRARVGIPCKANRTPVFSDKPPCK